jgi:hypothetical protein
MSYISRKALYGLKIKGYGNDGNNWAAPRLFFYGKGSENIELGTEFFVYKRIISAAYTAELVSDRVCYTFPRCRWYDVVLNVHASREDITDVINVTKSSFCEKLEWVFYQFPKYHMKFRC